MKLVLILLALVISFSSCSKKEKNDNLFVLTGVTDNDTEFVVFGKDTLRIDNGRFIDTIQLNSSQYTYIQLNTWEWPKLIYAEKNKSLKLDLTDSRMTAEGDVLNHYLLNIDSLLIPYSLRWDMKEEIFRETLKSELAANFQKIDRFFLIQSVSNEQVDELKQIEKLKVAHRTANFIGFQEKNGNTIDRNIYDFTNGINLNNKRLAKQINNRNFQYYFLLDKVSKNLPDSIYPFAAIDTVNKYSDIESI